ncbi:MULTISPECIES: DUF397 domain-containing protein [Streptomyces]|uniref:DUF397 domain-containing protein n=1 Tax=Streptomyces olivaceus TaxID=47716 RepID=A0ABS7W0A7_STROV|nr:MULTISPECIES: DUF397 domain-containing protein [Streptomyces]MBZ6089058.1 DUF397 domain-containing protein [Streptomyces olivaceus]MBZ6095568.1 DUF397 domain-containing protein [Streptomyces olivaceus]MBZ6111808.1 DUF397 domain-containing protein [Streptomyces olivaceus]MBZ6119837.1 DUF397 domain-containing protein [Streptomyces olivaceus]MBZ6122884.1 DUF397 domain-containing protein [Streptomyces olivaceus]
MTDRILPDSAELSGWRKSSHSGSEAGSCLEVLDGHRRGVPVRDSKNPHGPAVIVPGRAWAAFVAAVGNGGLPS